MYATQSEGEEFALARELFSSCLLANNKPLYFCRRNQLPFPDGGSPNPIALKPRHLGNYPVSFAQVAWFTMQHERNHV